jgi:hypothetical protein
VPGDVLGRRPHVDQQELVTVEPLEQLLTADHGHLVAIAEVRIGQIFQAGDLTGGDPAHGPPQVQHVVRGEPTAGSRPSSVLVAADNHFSDQTLEAEAGAVTVHVTNTDPIMHTFVVPELDVILAVPNDSQRRVTFEAPPRRVRLPRRNHTRRHARHAEGQVTAMDRRRWTTISGLAALAGGLAWIAKLAVIVATDGAQTDTGAAGVAFLLGAVLLCVGAATAALAATHGRPKLAVISAVVLSPVALAVTFVAIQTVVVTAAANVEPDYLRAEAGVLVTALLATAWGLGRAVTASRRRPIVPN